jgi:hypothetical protein
VRLTLLLLALSLSSIPLLRCSAAEATTISIRATPNIVGNQIRYCPVINTGGGNGVDNQGAGSSEGGGGSNQGSGTTNEALMCIITCVVAVQGPIPISPHFNINGTAYTVAGIENGSLPGVAVTHNTTHYALVFTCAPMQYQCDLSGEQSSDIISVEPGDYAYLSSLLSILLLLFVCLCCCILYVFLEIHSPLLS